MLKNNLFNRLFRAKELNAQAFKINRIKTLYPIYRKKLDKAKSLVELFELHKDAWWKGFQNKNLGPCPYGMFRTSDIGHMRPSEVYLGGIYGLITLQLTDWEKYKESRMGGNGFGLNPETKIYDIIMNQYRNHLKSNFKAIYEETNNLQGRSRRLQ